MSKRWVGVLIFLFLLLPGTGAAHEGGEDVTPLLKRVHAILLLIERGRENGAFNGAAFIWEDFEDPGSGSAAKEAGLKETAARIDKKYSSEVGSLLGEALKNREVTKLKKGVQTLAFLLMREKFDLLQSTFDNPQVSLDAQKTIFGLGQEYFLHVFVPFLRDPGEEVRFGQILEKMRASLEERKAQEFRIHKDDLIRKILALFELPLPARL